MYKKVIFRDRQELQADDLSNIQSFTQSTLKDFIKDAITEEGRYTGLLVSQKTATEIEVSPGQLYIGGQAYILEQPQTLNLFTYLPLNTKRVVSILVSGSKIETDIQPRDFLIDVTQGTTEPRAVAMQEVYTVNLQAVAGLESVDPQPPSVSSAIPIAYVYLGTTGIERIEQEHAFKLPNLNNVNGRLKEVEVWKRLTEPRISSITTDLASLSKVASGKADLRLVLELAGDVARLKEKLSLPDTYSSYEADYFGDDSKVDRQQTTAKVANGVLFPDVAKAEANLALFNPYDPNVRKFDNLILPNFESVARIETKGYSGDVSISAYQFQTHTIKQYTTYSWRWVYGWNWNWYWNWYYWYYYRYYSDYWWYGYWNGYGYWVQVPETHYRLETTTHSINGAILAQTFLVSSEMWLTALGLYFTQIDSNANLTVLICETEHGKPNLQKALSVVNVSPSSLNRYPQESFITLNPVLLKPGRYAIALITQGSHRVAVADGNTYLQGTLFYGTDGDYFTGDLTKDLLMKIYSAQFKKTRTEIMLQAVSLAGGISDISIEAPAVVPTGSSLSFELQVGGRWYPITDIGHLSSLPDIVPLRAVMLGTSDIQPALILSPRAIIASRTANSFTYVSRERTLPAPSSNITVEILLHNFNPSIHTITCQLISNQNIYTPAVITEEEENSALRKKYLFNITGGITRYKIKVQGTKSSSAPPFSIVEKIDIAV